MLKCVIDNSILKSYEWVDFEATAVTDPKVILEYAVKKHLLGQLLFNHLVKYCKHVHKQPIVRAFKLDSLRNTTKFKFGIEVPIV